MSKILRNSLSIRFFLLLISSFPAFAETFYVNAEVQRITFFSQESSATHSAWTDHFNFVLKGVQEIGNCLKSGNDVILVAPKSDQGMLSILLAAKISSKPVQVWLDDTNILNTSYCKVDYVGIWDNPVNLP